MVLGLKAICTKVKIGTNCTFKSRCLERMVIFCLIQTETGSLSKSSMSFLPRHFLLYLEICLITAITSDIPVHTRIISFRVENLSCPILLWMFNLVIHYENNFSFVQILSSMTKFCSCTLTLRWFFPFCS